MRFACRSNYSGFCLFHIYFELKPTLASYSKLWNLFFFVKLQIKWTAETSSFSFGRPQLLRAAIFLDKIQQPFKIEIDGAHGSKIGARCKIRLPIEMMSLIWYERLELIEISEVLPVTSWAQTHGQKLFESELRKILPIYVALRMMRC